ncbi:MAG: dephospho-CoA kinase [Candidatus Caenarcaniphilales bacterium]|nr:dephospho-CoA kinase [Candidatus Caenarcaniphilales bacterium]
MHKLAITGNIACGKSLVGEILEGKGVPVIDSDHTVHDLLSHDHKLIESICALVGSDSVLSENTAGIDRKKLGRLAFQDEALRHKIESIIHPEVFKATQNFFSKHSNEPVCANLIPLLFETGSEGRFDSIWLIYCDPMIQYERLRKRNPELSKEMTEQRLNAQMPQSEKLKRANLVIDNSGAIENTTQQVEQALQKICRK